MKKYMYIVVSIIVTMLVSGCAPTQAEHSNNTIPVGHANILSFKVPSDSEVKSMTVSVSTLPGATKKTFTNATDKATVQRILTWLKNSKEVGFHKPSMGGGYPPTLEIVLNNGNRIAIGPAQNVSSRKLVNGDTVISGKNVVDYVSLATPNNSNVILLYSPDLYKWISNHKWETYSGSF